MEYFSEKRKKGPVMFRVNNQNLGRIHPLNILLPRTGVLSFWGHSYFCFGLWMMPLRFSIVRVQCAPT